MKRLIQVYIRPYFGRMSLGLAVKFVGTIMDLFLPWILAYMIDTVIPRKDVRQLVFWGFAMLFCSVLALTASVAANRMASKVASEIVEWLRRDLFRKVMYLPSAQVDRWTKPTLISRLTTDTYNVHNMISRMQRMGVRSPILLLGGIVMTLTLDPVLASILLALMPVMGIIIWQLTKRSLPVYTLTQEAVDGFVRLVREDIAGIRVIKALSKMDYEKERFDRWNRLVVERERKAGMLTATLNPAMNLILNLGLVMVVVVGAVRVQNGTGDVGKILAFLAYFTIILNAMLSISKMFVMFSKGQASAERITQILETEDEEQIDRQMVRDEAAASGVCGAAEMVQEPVEKVCGPAEKACKSAGKVPEQEEESPGAAEEEAPEPSFTWQRPQDAFVAFQGVTFSYYPGKPVLKNISFSLRKGESLGIIGETGAGKTAVAALLLGLYQPDSGRIFVGGKDAKEQTFGQLRSQIGMVFQNDTLFEDTIYENVRLGRNLSKEQVERAIRAAQAADFVEEKSGRSQEMLNIRGANLSGGQKQRILVARALAGEPDVLILDDSSSALDYSTDLRLRQAISREYGQVTGIYIAQRISSISHCDHILVLENGDMMGYGTHEELLTSCRPYGELYQMQTGSL